MNSSNTIIISCIYPPRPLLYVHAPLLLHLRGSRSCFLSLSLSRPILRMIDMFYGKYYSCSSCFATIYPIAAVTLSVRRTARSVAVAAAARGRQRRRRPTRGKINCIQVCHALISRSHDIPRLTIFLSLDSGMAICPVPR